MEKQKKPPLTNKSKYNQTDRIEDEVSNWRQKAHKNNDELNDDKNNAKKRTVAEQSKDNVLKYLQYEIDFDNT